MAPKDVRFSIHDTAPGLSVLAINWLPAKTDRLGLLIGRLEAWRKANPLRPLDALQIVRDRNGLVRALNIYWTEKPAPQFDFCVHDSVRTRISPEYLETILRRAADFILQPTVQAPLNSRVSPDPGQVFASNTSLR